MRVRLTPLSATAGGTRLFEVVSSDLNTGTGELTLTGRDGRICLGLVGAWQVEVTASRLAPMSVDELERLHDGRSLLVVN